MEPRPRLTHRPGSPRPMTRVALLAATTAVITSLGVSTASAVPAPSAGHGHATAPASLGRNHEPLMPSGLGTTAPDAGCATFPAQTAIRSTTPTLRATVSDPDGDRVRAVFVLVDAATGRRLWTPAPTASQASGSVHTVTVPAGLLSSGHTYEWSVSAVDSSSRVGRVARCELAVDTAAPQAPVITAVEGSAPAVYLENQTAGGIGVAGEFSFDLGSASDAVAVTYSLTGGAEVRLDVPSGATRTTAMVVPSSAGPTVLVARSIDAAGNVSAEATYRFTVAMASSAARWTFDEGTGTVAADTGSTGSGRPLNLTAATAWTPGLLSDFGVDPADSALLFDAPEDAATTTGPVVGTGSSFSVVAFVRQDAAGPVATAVSQDGSTLSRFELGSRTGAGCAGALGSCWTFTMADADAADAAQAVAVSTVPVRIGAWTMLVGRYDSGAGTMQVDVCEFGTPNQPGAMSPVFGTAVTTSGAWNAGGAFRVGGALAAGAPAHPWIGAVSGVRTSDGVLDDAQVRMACSNGA